MRQPNLNKIEIVEPPIEELTKNNSSFKRACLSGCAAILFFIIIVITGIWIVIGPGPKKINQLPSSFPADFPLYDKDNIEQITFIDGKSKHRRLALAAIMPKILLSSLIAAEPVETPALPASSTARYWQSVTKLWSTLSLPADNEADTVRIEWHAIDAEPSFVLSYYRKEFNKKNFIISKTTTGKDVKELSFFKTSGPSGTISVYGDEKSRPGTDRLVLIVTLPSKNN